MTTLSARAAADAPVPPAIEFDALHGTPGFWRLARASNGGNWWFVSPDGKSLARDGLRYELLKIESRYQWYRQNSSWEFEPVKTTKRVADGDLTVELGVLPVDVDLEPAARAQTLDRSGWPRCGQNPFRG